MLQFQSLTGDRLVNSDIFTLLSKMSMLKGIMSRCRSTMSSQSIWSSKICSCIKFIACVQGRSPAMCCYPSVASGAGWLSQRQLLECEQCASSVFTTDPAKLTIRLQVGQFFNSSPATLAGIRSCSFLLDQLCFQFVQFRHVVSEEQVIA